MCDLTHSSHYSLSLFTQPNNSTLQGLRGVAVTDYLDYDEDYYAPGYYVEDYELFGEEPLDVDFFDDEEDLDSDMELLGPRTGRHNNPQNFKDRVMNRAFRQLNNRGYISGSLGLSEKEIRRVFRADGINPDRARRTGSGDIVVGPPLRTMGRRRGLPRPRYYD